MTGIRRVGVLAALLMAGGTVAAQAKDTYPPLDVLIASGETVIGQQIEYPPGTAQITAAIVTMAPGQETGWHVHDAPLFAHVLEGEITVDYGDGVVKSYRAGDSLLEAFRTPHNGTSTGAGALRLLAVFAGGEDVANTVMVEK